MHWTDRRERFRAVLAGDRCVHPGSVFDPISARIAEELGFEVGMFAGSIASFTVLGAPDLIVLTLTRVRRAGLPHQPRRQAAAAGRCRPRLRQRAERDAHGAGAGDRRRRGDVHRGHAAAEDLWREEAEPDLDRGRRRQDARRTRRARGPVVRHRRPHQCRRDDRHRRRGRARQGVRRRPASMRCSSPAA